MIACHVLAELREPETGVGLGNAGFPAPAVAMPVAPVHEYDCIPPLKRQVWLTWQVAPVQAKSKTKPVCLLAN
jgi:hypothetical protein